MQRTEKYYENDPFLTRAEGRVLLPAPTGRAGSGWRWTAPYFTRKGRPARRPGVLTLPDGRDLAVVDVHEQGGLIWHTLAPVPDAPCRTLPPAPPDPADRLGLAAGQDAAAHRRAYPFGPAAPDVQGGERGFPHRGRRCADGHQCPHLSGGLRQAELAANQIIWQDVPVRAWYPDKAQLEALCYRSKSPLRAPCASWRSPVRMCAPAAAPMWPAPARWGRSRSWPRSTTRAASG